MDAFISVIESQRSAAIAKKSAQSLVMGACAEMEKNYGQKCVSAVSKALWMMHGHPVAIYDRYAREGLARQIGKKRRVLKDYEEYYDCWHTQFIAHEAEICGAQNLLSESIFVARLEQYGVTTKGQLRPMIKQPWFANRIFDQWLLRVGDDRPQEGSMLVRAAQLLDRKEATLQASSVRSSIER